MTVEDSGVRVTVRGHDDGERVVVSVFRSARRGWVGTGEMCGTPDDVLDWIRHDGKWPELTRFLPVLREWLAVTAGIAG